MLRCINILATLMHGIGYINTRYVLIYRINILDMLIHGLNYYIRAYHQRIALELTPLTIYRQ